MYDIVDIKLNCPICGKELTDFQTKNFECLMDKIVPGVTGVSNFMGLKNCGCYTTCNHQLKYNDKLSERGIHIIDVVKHVWIDVTIPIVNGKLTPNIDKWKVDWKEGGSSGGIIDFAKINKKEAKKMVAKFNREMKVKLDENKYKVMVIEDVVYVSDDMKYLLGGAVSKEAFDDFWCIYCKKGTIGMWYPDEGMLLTHNNEYYMDKEFVKKME